MLAIDVAAPTSEELKSASSVQVIDDAIAEVKTAVKNEVNFKGSKIIIGKGKDIDLEITQDKYYVVKVVLFDLDGKKIDDGKITIYSPSSTKTIKVVI